MNNSGPTLPAGMTIAQAQEKLDAMYWHHSIDFGAGLVAKGGGSLATIEMMGEALLHGLHLKDKSLLDIGAWNGAFSFRAKQCGASRVVACDQYCWTHPLFKGFETFEFARSLLDLTVEAIELDVPFVTPETAGTHDAVLFSGVFYHLLEAVHLTRQISQCAKHLLVVETHQDALDNPDPAMIFYPGTTLNGDGSNWWGPNPHCMFELLTEFGFSEILYRDTPGFSGRSRGIYHAFRDAKSMAAMGVSGVDKPWVSLSDPKARAALFAPSRKWPRLPRRFT